MLVEGRHFLPDVDPESLGHKTLAVNLSDLAAMGATPRWALLAGALPDADERWLAAFARGLFALADRFGVDADRRRHDARSAQPVRDDHRRAAGRARRSRAPARAPATTSGSPGRSAMRCSRSPRCRAARRSTTRRARAVCARGSSVPSRASRSASACAASRPLRSTSRTDSPATSRTSSMRRASAPHRARARFRAAPRSRKARRSRARRWRSRACSPAATTTSCASRRRRRARPRARDSRARCGVAVTRIGVDHRGTPGLRVATSRGATHAALPHAFDHFPRDAPDAAASCCTIRRTSSRSASAPGSRRWRRARSARWSRSRSRWCCASTPATLAFARRDRRAVRRRRVGVARDRPRARRARSRQHRHRRGGGVPRRAVLRRHDAAAHRDRVRAVPVLRHREAAADPAARRGAEERRRRDARRSRGGRLRAHRVRGRPAGRMCATP